MSARWEALHTSLSRSIRTTNAVQSFAALRLEAAALSPYVDPSALVADLTSPTGDLDAKDRVLNALVLAVREATALPERRLARAMLSLAMWPGLDAHFRHCLRTSIADADELASLITCAFTEAVDTFSPVRASRSAATLIANTKRRMRVILRRARRKDSRTQSLDELEARYAEDQHTCGIIAASTRAIETEPESFWAHLRASHSDVEIVVRVVLWGETTWQIAQHLGVTHEAARKRYQRALRRLRNLFSEACPKSPEDGAFEGVSAAEGAGR